MSHIVDDECFAGARDYYYIFSFMWFLEDRILHLSPSILAQCPFVPSLSDHSVKNLWAVVRERIYIRPIRTKLINEERKIEKMKKKKHFEFVVVVVVGVVVGRLADGSCRNLLSSSKHFHKMNALQTLTLQAHGSVTWLIWHRHHRLL